MKEALNSILTEGGVCLLAHQSNTSPMHLIREKLITQRAWSELIHSKLITTIETDYNLYRREVNSKLHFPMNMENFLRTIINGRYYKPNSNEYSDAVKLIEFITRQSIEDCSTLPILASELLRNMESDGQLKIKDEILAIQAR